MIPNFDQADTDLRPDDTPWPHIRVTLACGESRIVQPHFTMALGGSFGCLVHHKHENVTALAFAPTEPPVLQRLGRQQKGDVHIVSIGMKRDEYTVGEIYNWLREDRGFDRAQAIAFLHRISYIADASLGEEFLAFLEDDTLPDGVVSQVTFTDEPADSNG